MSTEPRICWNCRALERQLGHALDALRERNDQLAVAAEALEFYVSGADDRLYTTEQWNSGFRWEKTAQKALALINPTPKKESDS